MPTQKEQIRALVKKILSEHDGKRPDRLASMIREKTGFNIKSIRGELSAMIREKKLPLATTIPTSRKPSGTRSKSSGTRKEESFYPPFAAYLVRIKECTNAIPLGGKKFGGRWGTPDVIGVLRPGGEDRVKFPDEIVSAEIKTNDQHLVTAFGQACAYRQFSHKTYLVVPAPKDTARLESLCRVFGIGLVYFDPKQKPEKVKFDVKLPAQKHSPDMLYVNQNIKGEIGGDLYGN